MRYLVDICVIEEIAHQRLYCLLNRLHVLLVVFAHLQREGALLCFVLYCLFLLKRFLVQIKQIIHKLLKLLFFFHELFANDLFGADNGRQLPQLDLLQHVVNALDCVDCVFVFEILGRNRKLSKQLIDEDDSLVLVEN